MNSIERFKAFLKEKKISKSEFYRKTGISNGYLDKVKSIGTDKVEIILDAFPELNLYWLIKGKGDSTLAPSDIKILNSKQGYTDSDNGDSFSLQEPNSAYKTSKSKDEVNYLKEKIEDLRSKNSLLERLLKEKDERIKLLIEKLDS